MRRPSPIFVALVCLAFAAPIWANGPVKNAGQPQVAYVSTGTGGQIYAVDVNPTSATYGQTHLLLSGGTDYEGLVVGPNPDSSTVVANPVIVYACDTGGGKIVRLNPGSITSFPPSLIAEETIYTSNGTNPTNPQCGRITSTGDLIVTDAAAGDSSWYEFVGLADIKIGGGNLLGPTKLGSAQGLLEGTALKNGADLLVVDNAGNQVFRSSASSYTSETTFIASNQGLKGPFGIAKNRTGMVVYVSNEGTENIASFSVNANGTASSLANCSAVKPTKSKGVAGLAMSPGDTLYVAGTYNNGNGALFSLNATNGCPAGSTTIASSFAVPLVGVALALPDFTSVPQTVPVANGTAFYNFGYSGFEVTEATLANNANPCSLTLVTRPTAPAFLSAPISTLIGVPPGSVTADTTAAADLGWDGFVSVAQNTTAITDACVGGDGNFHFVFGTDISQALGSPQVISCADDFTGCAVDTANVYPFLNLVPSDNTIGGTKKTKATCQFFLVNGGPPNSIANDPSQSGFFCGWNPPLSNTFLGDTPDIISGSLSAKFRLSILGQPCSSTNAASFIGNAVALASLEQITDASGNPVSVPIGIGANGGSVIFAVGNKNYTASLNLNSGCTLPNGVTGACPAGEYTLTATFLTNNTADSCQSDTMAPCTGKGDFGQSIYTVQTTKFCVGTATCPPQP